LLLFNALPFIDFFVVLIESAVTQYDLDNGWETAELVTRLFFAEPPGYKFTNNNHKEWAYRKTSFLYQC